MGYTLIDLFCGAGGLTHGFVQAGFRPIFAAEHTPSFAATYAANYGDHVYQGTVEEITTPPQADIVIGGPPCQGFSTLNKNRVDDPRRTLWYHFLRVVELTRARVFVMENVPELLKSAEGARALSAAKEMGFLTSSGVLLASGFGVPQNRRRAFIIGCRDKVIDLPVETGEITTVRQAFNGIPEPGNDWPKNTPIRSDQLHISRQPSELSLKRFATIPEGGNRLDIPYDLLPNCWKNKPAGYRDVMGRLRWDEPARCTVRTEFFKPEKGRYLHPAADRPITHFEACRLQSFPDDYLWCGSRSEIAAQIGNAVPPKLAAAVARAVSQQWL